MKRHAPAPRGVEPEGALGLEGCEEGREGDREDEVEEPGRSGGEAHAQVTDV
jgi:hypothetical protein